MIQIHRSFKNIQESHEYFYNAVKIEILFRSKDHEYWNCISEP